jgi:hypothetical protein
LFKTRSWQQKHTGRKVGAMGRAGRRGSAMAYAVRTGSRWDGLHQLEVGVHSQSESCIFDDVSGVLAHGAAGSNEGMGVPLKAAARAAPKKW